MHQYACLAAHQALADEVKASADVVWPLTHSAWGEQGQLHAVLEAAGVQFVGTPPAKAADATDKLRWAIDAVLHAAALETESQHMHAMAGIREGRLCHTV